MIKTGGVQQGMHIRFIIKLNVAGSATMISIIGLREIFECAYLKFTVSGQSKQTNKLTSIHTRVCNAVTLVWGLLRLTPINSAVNLAYSCPPTHPTTQNINTSEMIHHHGAILNEQQTADLLICHGTQQDLSLSTVYTRA